MNSTVTAAEAQSNLPRLLKELPESKAITITNHGRIAGFLKSKDRMKAIIESMEILSNREGMNALHAFETGRSQGKDISSLDD